jgi:hypothetical protein
MRESPVISEGMNQRIGALVVEMTTAKNIPERLHAIDKLAADADSHVNTYLREIGGDAPSIEKVRMEIQDKLDVAKANKPEERSEELEFWTEYVNDLENQLANIVDIWGSRVGYRAFVEKWDNMYSEWGNIIAAISMIVEGGQAQVFDVRRKMKRDVMLPVYGVPPDLRLGQEKTRDLMIRAMGLRDFGQEVITSNIEILRGVGELDRLMFVAAGKFSAVFSEIFGDLSVYQENYLQHLALHRADEKGKLEEVLQQREMMRGGGSDY